MSARLRRARTFHVHPSSIPSGERLLINRLRRLVRLMTHSPAIWLLCLSLIAACSPEPSDTTASARAGVAPSVAAKPIDLETWQAVQEKGDAAVKIEDIDERISACRAFLEHHPDHPQAIKVIEALTDALVMTGNFDRSELSRLVERRAELDAENLALPVALVRAYHIKHGLPIESGLAVLDFGHRRIQLAREDLAYRKLGPETEFLDLTLQQQQTDTWLMEALLYLHYEIPGDALDALARLDAELEVTQAGLTPERGGPRFSNGAADARLVLRAAASQQLGQHDEAREALMSSLGFLDDPDLSRLYADLREGYGLRPPESLAVKAEPLPAQDFALKNLDGDTVRLSDYRGDVVFVTFWATWCTYCPGEMAELQAFQREEADQGVTVLTISIDQFRDRPMIRPFLERFNLELPVLLEEPEQLTGYDYTSAIPALYVIDREGRIAHARLGYDPTLKDRLAGEIGGIVAGNRESGRTLLTVEQAPPGYGVQWQQPLSDEVFALAVAPPIGDQPGQLAAVNRQALTR